MEQSKTNPNHGLRALIDELYARVSRVASAAASGKKLSFANDINMVAVPVAPAAVAPYDAPAYTPSTTGFLRVDSRMSVLSVNPSEAVIYSMRLGGAIDATAPVAIRTSGAGASPYSGAALSNVYPCTAGVAMTFGIQAGTVNNCQAQPGQCQVIVQELQTTG